MSLFSLVALGFFLGMRHATDPDHVVAVATIVARERSLRGAGLIGALWGAGHTLTILLVGGAIIVFGLVLPVRLGLSLEFSVAVMLVLLGGLNVVTFLRELRSGQAAHGHPHGPGEAAQGEAPTSGGERARRGSWRPLLVGVVHGLAGSAAVALMVLATIREAAWAMVYLGCFGAGTVAGMMLVTSAMAAPLALAARRSSALGRHLGWVSGLLSVGFGLFLVYEIGVVDGLFSSQPRWEPR